MSSQEEPSDNNSMPDLIVNECLFGCKGCPAIWENSQTGHRIICKCACDHVRRQNNDGANVVLQGASLVGSPKRPAVVTSTGDIEENTIER